MKYFLILTSWLLLSNINSDVPSLSYEQLKPMLCPGMVNVIESDVVLHVSVALQPFDDFLEKQPSVVIVHTAGVWRNHDVVELPELRVPRQWLFISDVEERTAKMVPAINQILAEQGITAAEIIEVSTGFTGPETGRIHETIGVG